MKVCYTCSDAIQAMTRGEVCKVVQSWEEATSEHLWNQAKQTFARRCRTAVRYVYITAVKIVPDDYSPVR